MSKVSRPLFCCHQPNCLRSCLFGTCVGLCILSHVETNKSNRHISLRHHLTLMINVLKILLLPVCEDFDMACLPFWTWFGSLLHYSFVLSSVHLCVDVCGVKCVSIRAVDIFRQLQKCSSLAGCMQRCGLDPWSRSPPKRKPELEMAVKPTAGPCCI